MLYRPKIINNQRNQVVSMASAWILMPIRVLIARLVHGKENQVPDKNKGRELGLKAICNEIQ